MNFDRKVVKNENTSNDIGPIHFRYELDENVIFCKQSHLANETSIAKKSQTLANSKVVLMSNNQTLSILLGPGWGPAPTHVRLNPSLTTCSQVRFDHPLPLQQPIPILVR